jgi:single-stranded-DNA-specific exonuclease
MAKQARTWMISPKNKEEIERLSQEADVSPRIAALLLERGIEDGESARRFLVPKLRDLIDPTLLKGMHAAVERLLRALENEEKVVVWGDYDVDGVTSTTLLLRYFKEVGFSVDFFVPNRFRDGYGLSEENLVRLAGEGYRVVVTVDCGISNTKEVAVANGLGVDVIIVDHHEVPREIPRACAVIDPLQETCGYGFTGMAAAGLTFHLLMAIRAEMRKRGYFKEGAKEPDLREYLDIAAVGTIADLAPLQGVNRILTKVGLGVLAQTQWPGLQALRDVCMKGRARRVDAGFVGFQMGPRINAAGRLSSASRGVDMLVSDDYGSALKIAEQVDEENLRRREIQDEIFVEAMEMMADVSLDDLKHAFVLWKDGWHAGVTGIVASKLVDHFHRPFVLIAMDGEDGKASGRSIRGFHMVRALTQCEELLVGFGGHAHAAGLTIQRRNLEAFAEKFDGLARESLQPADLIPSLTLHEEIAFRDIDGAFMDEMASMEPYGMGNRRPLFCASGIRVVRERIVTGGHLQLTLEGGGYELRAIAFGRGEEAPGVDSKISVAFSPEWNEWKGRRTIQLNVRDFRTEDPVVS